MNLEKQNVEYNQDEIEIDLTRLLKAVIEKLWLVVAVALLFGSCAYLGTKLFIVPTYTSSFTAYVNNKTDQSETKLSSSDISASQSLVNTYSAILVSEPILEEAAEAAGINMTYEELAGTVEVSTVDDTEIIQVSVTMEDPEQAKAFAEQIASISPDYISTIVTGSSMQVIATPKLPTKISGPSYLRNTALGFLAGAFLVAAIIVLKELMDDRVKGERELEDRYGIPVMGAIPDPVNAKKAEARAYGYGA